MWILFALGASMFWGLAYTFNQEIYEKISVLTAFGLTSIIGGLLAIIISYLLGDFKLDITEIQSSKSLQWYFIAGIGVSIAAELLIGFSIASKSAILASLIEITYPVFIVIFGYILFKNNTSLATVLGGLVVMIGVGIIYFYNR
jgi:drug/metabolite transporter (DMT)-like permease